MSLTGGEKARAAIQRRNRTARRAKDRARLAEIKAGAATDSEKKAPEKKDK